MPLLAGNPVVCYVSVTEGQRQPLGPGQKHLPGHGLSRCVRGLSCLLPWAGAQDSPPCSPQVPMTPQEHSRAIGAGACCSQQRTVLCSGPASISCMQGVVRPELQASTDLSSDEIRGCGAARAEVRPAPLPADSPLPWEPGPLHRPQPQATSEEDKRGPCRSGPQGAGEDRPPRTQQQHFWGCLGCSSPGILRGPWPYCLSSTEAGAGSLGHQGGPQPVPKKRHRASRWTYKQVRTAGPCPRGQLPGASSLPSPSPALSSEPQSSFHVHI